MKPNDLKQYFIFDNIAYSKKETNLKDDTQANKDSNSQLNHQHLPQITKQNIDLMTTMKNAGIIASQNDSFNSTS